MPGPGHYERTDHECGCAWIKLDPAGSWYQVVACPGHVFDCAPLDGVPAAGLAR